MCQKACASIQGAWCSLQIRYVIHDTVGLQSLVWALTGAAWMQTMQNPNRALERWNPWSWGRKSTWMLILWMELEHRTHTFNRYSVHLHQSVCLCFSLSAHSAGPLSFSVYLSVCGSVSLPAFQPSCLSFLALCVCLCLCSPLSVYLNKHRDKQIDLFTPFC